MGNARKPLGQAAANARAKSETAPRRHAFMRYPTRVWKSDRPSTNAARAPDLTVPQDTAAITQLSRKAARTSVRRAVDKDMEGALPLAPSRTIDRTVSSASPAGRTTSVDCPCLCYPHSRRGQTPKTEVFGAGSIWGTPTETGGADGLSTWERFPGGRAGGPHVPAGTVS